MKEVEKGGENSSGSEVKRRLVTVALSPPPPCLAVSQYSMQITKDHIGALRIVSVHPAVGLLTLLLLRRSPPLSRAPGGIDRFPI